MTNKYTVILLLSDGSEVVIDEVFQSIKEVKAVINDYYSIRKIMSHTGYFEAINGYTICESIEGKVFERK